MTDILDELVKNAPERIEYQRVLSALRPVLLGLPPKIVTIDGLLGVGKTTLGRFLAWRFNITLLETDLYLSSDESDYSYQNDEVKRIIECRLGRKRPILVEGVCSMKLLKEVGLEPAFSIRVTCSAANQYPSTRKIWATYIKQHPDSSVDLCLEIPALES